MLQLASTGEMGSLMGFRDHALSLFNLIQYVVSSSRPRACSRGRLNLLYFCTCVLFALGYFHLVCIRSSPWPFLPTFCYGRLGVYVIQRQSIVTAFWNVIKLV